MNNKLLWLNILVACVGISCFWLISREQRCQNSWQAVVRTDQALDQMDNTFPDGWVAGAPGVRRGEFSVAGGTSIHMLGIGSWLGVVDMPVVAAKPYCIALRALADSSSSTAIRTRWIWRNADGVVRERVAVWQAVRRWNGEQDTQPWSYYTQTDVAPPGATMLDIHIEPASDDRLYLDQVVVRQSILGTALPEHRDVGVRAHPWPAGYTAAVSFSYDWETAMGGLIHSRSIDPLANIDPELRGMRMRDGLTNTLRLFAPYNFQATYFVNGYNFLSGNTARAQYMGNPTFSWASAANGWLGDTWVHVPWFSRDPYGDVRTNPAWYFGDLINPVRNAHHDIQSHTFSHFYGGLATPAEWQRDIEAWNAMAATRGVAPATALAFPWSSSAGMRYETWELLAKAGYTTITRTAWNPRLPQYHIVSADEALCKPLPGHEQLMVCPDYYLTVGSRDGALALLHRIRGTDGMIDFWAHTEEVVTPEQIAAWQSVVDAVAQAKDVWVAPMREITARQRAVASLQWHVVAENSQIRTLVVSNPSALHINDVVLTVDRPGFVFADTRTPSRVISLLPHARATLRIVIDDASLP